VEPCSVSLCTDGDLALAQYGIFTSTKSTRSRLGKMIGRDVSGRGVQTALLKLMEETEVPIREATSPTQLQAAMEFQRKGRHASRSTRATFSLSFPRLRQAWRLRGQPSSPVTDRFGAEHGQCWNSRTSCAGRRPKICRLRDGA
jgi:hypothetical protein